MILYHGSNITVPKPGINAQTKFLDFGRGFYTTPDKEQAMVVAKRVCDRWKTGSPTVSVYELDKSSIFSEHSVLCFSEKDERWLELVSRKRTGKYTGAVYDFVYGPIADDDTCVALVLYQSGILNKEQTLERLRKTETPKQLVLCTNTAVKYLRYKGTV